MPRGPETANCDALALPGYHPLPDVPDEMLDAQGRVRPLWTRLMRYLRDLPAAALAADLARADLYLRDSGVFYRQYGPDQSVERAWPLSHVPVLLDEGEWSALADGLIQRADLLETVMADLYGANRLVASGRLPPALIADNPEWLRPLVGVAPRDGHFLHFVAFELGRGPDGNWWVLADRTQAPSGAGYALENRVATSRALSDVFAGEQVHRLAGFFRAFRDTLLSQCQDAERRVGILTPGPMNETYFEHAYIARYLGFTLVQGDDLSVHDGRLMVRTVSGPRPIEVLWRRLDSTYADPLELDPASRIGTPGMISALRAGGATLVNALGSGVLETRALMAFLPKLAPELVGADLAIPNVATWWCGDPDARAAVQAAPERMILSPALSGALPFAAQAGQYRAADLPPDELGVRLARDGAGLIAQEAVTLSTTPALVDGALVARPMSLRVFLARTAQGWQVMPGGFARIGATTDPAAVAMQQGGHAADVWVVGARAVDGETLVPASTGTYRRPVHGALPSRAADNLFWLGRYVERAEWLIRLLRAHHVRLAESGPAAAPLLAALAPVLTRQGIESGSQGVPAGLLDTLGAAIGSAGRVRDRFSPDAWSALADLDKTAHRMAARVRPGDDAARALSALLRKLAGITGLVHDNMYRFIGWRFLSVGRMHERAMGMADMLAHLTRDDVPEGALDMAIELGDSVLTHRRRFSVATSRETVIDLLALDPMNPRSLRRQIDGLREQIDLLPGSNVNGALSPLSRAVLRLHVDLAVADPLDLPPQALAEMHSRIAALSDQLTEAFFQ